MPPVWNTYIAVDGVDAGVVADLARGMVHQSLDAFVNLDARYSQITYQTSPFDGHNLVGSAEFAGCGDAGSPWSAAQDAGTPTVDATKSPGRASWPSACMMPPRLRSHNGNVTPT